MEMVGKIKEKKHMYNKPSEPKDFWKTRFHTESNKITQNPFKTFLVNLQEDPVQDSDPRKALKWTFQVFLDIFIAKNIHFTLKNTRNK